MILQSLHWPTLSTVRHRLCMSWSENTSINNCKQFSRTRFTMKRYRILEVAHYTSWIVSDSSGDRDFRFRGLHSWMLQLSQQMISVFVAAFTTCFIIWKYCQNRRRDRSHVPNRCDAHPSSTLLSLCTKTDSMQDWQHFPTTSRNSGLCNISPESAHWLLFLCLSHYSSLHRMIHTIHEAWH